MSHQSELIGADIHAYLAEHERKELLRFLTCGSVDDGKSTLIGRLLHDSKMIYEDQLAAIQKDSLKVGTVGNDIDLALLVDGLQAEREQGITIDVAYRYFSTAKRKFIIADTPGHEQYTRNMATGASNCDLAVILIDARYGVQTQTRRHSFIVSLLGIRHVVVAVNKMDLADYSRTTFEKIRQDFLDFSAQLQGLDIRFIPMSALKGDNVVNPSAAMPWYEGPPLMRLLNEIEIRRAPVEQGTRFPVQWVNRPNLDFRGYSGTLAAGTLKKGDAVLALPSRRTSRVKALVTYDGELEAAFPGQAVTVVLEDEIDVSRGDMLTAPDDPPHWGSRFDAHIVWMADSPLIPGKQYDFKHTARIAAGTVARIDCRIDVNTLARSGAGLLELNEIGLCEVALNAGIAYDPYERCKTTGAFIVIDRLSNVTVGAGMIVGPARRAAEVGRVSPEERAARFGHKPATLWLTGAHRLEAAYRLERALFERGYASAVLDEEPPGVGATVLAQALNRAGLICIVAVAETLPEDAEHPGLPADRFDLNAAMDSLGLIRPTFEPEYMI